LLRNPLLLAEGESGEEYILVRRHSAWLKYWLAKFPDWTLHVDKDVVRLRKLPPDLLDETRQAVDRASGTVFSRRRYALLCLALAALERADRQITLGQIADRVMEFVSADQDLSRHGLLFDIGNYDQRRELIHVIRLLMDTGVLRKLDGDERQFLNRNVTTDVLYDINRSVLAAILNVSRSPSAIERMETGERPSLERVAELIDDPMGPGASNEGARSRTIRSRLVRILLDDPILYFHELNGEERLYLEQHRSYLLAQIYEATGLRAEVRGEGIAMVDDDGSLTDVLLPEESTDGHLSLLVAGWLAEFARNHSGEAVPRSIVQQYVGSLIAVHGSRWRKEVREPGAEAQLTEDALLRLRALRLVRLTDEGVLPLPACGRYAACNLIGGPAMELTGTNEE
jgi:uncharacterized protein (TIGR02678 family)